MGKVVLCLVIKILTTAIVFSQDTVAAGQRDTVIPAGHAAADTVPWFTEDTIFNRMLDESFALQQYADSILYEANELRKQILFMVDSYEKSKLQVRIAGLEEEAKYIQDKADKIYLKLQENSEPAETYDLRKKLLILDTIINDIKVYHYNLEAMKEDIGISKDSSILASVNKEESYVKEDEQFKIFDNCPYSVDKPFETKFSVPDGVFYRIQMAAHGNPVPYDHFGGIYPVTAELTSEGITRYYAGKINSYDIAQRALKQVRAAGFKDAFIVGYFNRQRMAVEKVQEYEKER